MMTALTLKYLQLNNFKFKIIVSKCSLGRQTNDLIAQQLAICKS